ncbi:MAG: SEC-C metal-binding domain-containing protein [Phycisphaerae bacterium]
MNSSQHQQKTPALDPQRKDDDDTQQPAKLHWWNKCPCNSGLRFGKCCGANGEDTCRYEVE